jgi:hypothetical protein
MLANVADVEGVVVAAAVVSVVEDALRCMLNAEEVAVVGVVAGAAAVAAAGVDVVAMH